MKQKISKTFTAQIYIAGQIETIERACREFGMRRGACVTVEPLKYIYTGGAESGARIGFIQYPRFEKPESEIKSHAKELATSLMEACCQLSCSIVTPEQTTWMYLEQKETSKLP